MVLALPEIRVSISSILQLLPVACRLNLRPQLKLTNKFVSAWISLTPSLVYMYAATGCVASVAKTLFCCCTATTGVDKHGCEFSYPSLPFLFVDQSFPAALRAKNLLGLIMKMKNTIKSLRGYIPYIGPVVGVLVDVVKALNVSVRPCS